MTFSIVVCRLSHCGAPVFCAGTKITEVASKGDPRSQGRGKADHLRCHVVAHRGFQYILAHKTTKRFSLGIASCSCQEQRRQLDLEEARLQAEQRKQAIKRAREIQYMQTDRAKTLQGAVLLTDVLREREAQIRAKERR